MKKLPILIALATGLLMSSCAKKSPEFVNTIPDDAFLVVTMHPQQIFEKGQLSAMESLKSQVTDEFLLEIIENPSKSGLMLNEYAYLFVYFKNEQPMVGFVAGMANQGNFKSMVNKLKEKSGGEFVDFEGYTMYAPDEEAMLAWNKEEVLLLGSPDMELTADEFKAELSRLVNLEKESSITSMVDFKDFAGKMKDLNIWVSADELRTVMEKGGAMKNLDFDLPFDLYNNYGQLFIEFADGAMYAHSESHFSEEVSKNVEQFMVTKPKMNEKLLEIAPGGDLLVGLAFSLDLEKMQKMIEKMNLPEMEGMGDKVEEATGIPSKEIFEALTGDFVLSVNGVKDGGMIPVEALIGIGLKNDVIQKKLMGNVENMVPVENHGDFFLINANGIEIYSGIVSDIWVITNVKGYKDAIAGGGLSASLKNSKFMDYAGGGMGMYMNLDMSSYPAPLQSMMSQNEKTAAMFELMAESLVSLGVESSQYNSDMTLITAKKNENSLLTMMKLAEAAEK